MYTSKQLIMARPGLSCWCLRSSRRLKQQRPVALRDESICCGVQGARGEETEENAITKPVDVASTVSLEDSRLAHLQVLVLQQKAQAAEAAARNAETVASAAMSAAEGAVREEMEAAAVAKSTASALNTVLAELKDLGVSFDTTDKLERSLEAKGVSRVGRPSSTPLLPLSLLVLVLMANAPASMAAWRPRASAGWAALPAHPSSR